MTMTITLNIPDIPKIERAKSWTTIRRQHIKQQPTCQACGTGRLLTAHHIIPVHVDPSKELDPNNLITLCENTNTGFCHFIFGHLAINWFKWDPNVISNVGHHHLAVEFAWDSQDVKGKPV